MGRDLKGDGSDQMTYCPGIFKEGVKKTRTVPVRITCAMAGTRTHTLPNTMLGCYMLHMNKESLGIMWAVVKAISEFP
jgi:hypothetical protein